MPGKRALIFANGDRLKPEAVKNIIKENDYLVAADGGLYQLYELGLTPDLLIGDFDSIEPLELDRITKEQKRVMRFPVHKNETDLELALQVVAKDGFTHILILGAVGGRLDMTLANIMLLLLPELEGQEVRLENGLEEIFFILPGVAGKEITGKPGDRISLLPWGGPASGIRTEGLFYPLNQDSLYQEHSRGISNKMLAGSARVSLEAGLLLCIHTRLDQVID